MKTKDATEIRQEINWLEESWVYAFEDNEEHSTLSVIWKRIRELRKEIHDPEN